MSSDLTLQHLSDGLAALVERVGPSAVRVEAGRRAPSSGAIFSADGVVLTADHAIEEEDGIEVTLHDGRSLPAKLLGRDAGVDLAVLKIEGASGLPSAAWAEGDGLKVGHLVLAVARPGRGARASLGIICARGESWRPHAGCRIDRYVETDLALSPGFSGSLLVDVAKGAVVGLNTSGLLRGRSLALPTATLRRVAEAVLAKGRVERGYLGIGTQPVRLTRAVAAAAAAGQESGLLVMGVDEGSPADRAGLLVGDVLVALHGRPIRHVGDLFELLDEERIGVESTARIVRGGEVREVKIVVGSRS